MNNPEGLRRLARALHWMGIAGAAYFAGCIAVEMNDRYPNEPEMFEWLLAAVASYAAGRAAAWIVTGFAQPR